jgi:putative transposase
MPNNNIIYSSKYDVVWTPKYRRPVLVGAIAKRGEQLIRQIAAKYDAEIIALEIMPDHVHRSSAMRSRSSVRYPSAGEEH